MRKESGDVCITELNFWRKNIDSLNLRKFGGYSCPDTLVFSDASTIGCGGYMVKASSSVFHSTWSDEKQLKSSIFKEPRTVYLALRAYGCKFQNRSIKWFSDSHNCVRLVSVGSTKSDLEQALKFFSFF